MSATQIHGDVEVRAINGDLLCTVPLDLPLQAVHEHTLKQAIESAVRIPSKCFQILVSSHVALIFDAEADWEGVFKTACITGEDISAKYFARALGDVFVEGNFNPLHMATYYCRPKLVKALLQEGFNVNRETCVLGDRCTPLHIAAKTGDLDTMKLLLSASADVHAENIDGDRPLHFAACRVDHDFVNLLLSANADVNAVNCSGETALDYAADLGCTDVLFALSTVEG